MEETKDLIELDESFRIPKKFSNLSHPKYVSIKNNFAK